MKDLDRPGIFRARPIHWYVRNAQHSQAIAISIEFVILSQLDGTAWVDWSQYDEHHIFGDFWVVKATGEINTQAVENLAKSIGWYGDLGRVFGNPPDFVVQITVKEEEYKGRTTLKVAWINPGDFTPTPSNATREEVADMQLRFGSLLRAAASAAINAVGPSPSPEKPAASKPKPKAAPPTCDPTPAADDDLPF